VPIALGSDGGGSLRIPASFCGAFSLKPTLGRVATHPLSSSEQLSHAGAITRSVVDSALALDVLAGPDPRDPNALPPPSESYLDALDASGPPIRCAFAATLFAVPVAPDVARCVASAVDRMRAVPQLDIATVEPDWRDPIETFETLWTSRATLYRDLDDAARRTLDPGFSRLVELSSRIGVADHLRALQKRADFSRRVAQSFRDFDVLLLPMLPIEPFAAEDDGPPAMDASPAVPWARWTPFSYPFNVTGQPAASIPCGWTERGLPVGLQVVGRRFEERTVLRFCRLWEQAFDAHARRPRVFAGAGDASNAPSTNGGRT
jgi:aspartyl-tRNA(Asn)/glutamyl-tRNA(Gln) amidotransferase subunit A